MTKSTGYQIRVRRSAEKDLDRLPHDLYERIASVIRKLSEEPRPQGCKRLRDRPDYRIRVGSYRIIYTLDDADRRIEIVAIGHRSDIYRK